MQEIQRQTTLRIFIQKLMNEFRIDSGLSVPISPPKNDIPG
jgi:hypothetical protein